MSERVDLVDTSGVIQLADVEREDARQQQDGLHMQIVIVVIFNSAGQVLVHERSARKTVNPNDVDHICGGVKAGEKPEQAAHRETKEEGGVELSALHLVAAGVNKYQRYRWLFVGTSQDEPVLSEPDEINWIAWKSIAELEAARDDASLTFVDEFFEETQAARARLTEVQT